MDKSGMRRYDQADHGADASENGQRHHFERNDKEPVPELQGRAKLSKEKARPIKYDGKRPTTF